MTFDITNNRLQYQAHEGRASKNVVQGRDLAKARKLAAQCESFRFQILRHKLNLTNDYVTHIGPIP